LFIYFHLFDDRNMIVFKPDNKNNFAIYILADHLIDSNIITQTEKSVKRTIITAGISKSSEKKLLRIDFKDDENKNESLILDIKDNLESASNTIYLLLRKMRNIIDTSLNTLDQSPNRSISDKEQDDDISEISDLSPSLTCPSCGTQLKEVVRFCPSCGCPVGGSTTNTTSSITPPMIREQPTVIPTRNKERVYYKGEGELIIRTTKHHGVGRKAASFIAIGPIGYAILGRDSKRTSKVQGTLVVTNKAIYCAGNKLEYDNIIALTIKGTIQKKIYLTLDKNLQAGGRGQGIGGGSKISIEIEINSKDIDGIFRALEQARMEDLE